MIVLRSTNWMNCLEIKIRGKMTGFDSSRDFYVSLAIISLYCTPLEWQASSGFIKLHQAYFYGGIGTNFGISLFSLDIRDFFPTSLPSFLSSSCKGEQRMQKMYRRCKINPNIHYVKSNEINTESTFIKCYSRSINNIFLG